MPEVLTLKWDDITLVRFDKLEELKEAVGERLGATVSDVTIKHVNYLRDTADLEIIYKPNEPGQGKKSGDR